MGRIYISTLSTKSKNALYDYYRFELYGKKLETDVIFGEITPIDCNKIAKLRNVGKITVKEIQNYCKENSIDFKPVRKQSINSRKNRKQLA